MGYILPITPYQYYDYKRRVTRKRKGPYFIDPTFRAVLAKKRQGYNQPSDSDQHVTTSIYHPTEETMSINEPHFDLLTNKGNYINTQV